MSVHDVDEDSLFIKWAIVVKKNCKNFTLQL